MMVNNCKKVAYVMNNDSSSIWENEILWKYHCIQYVNNA